jgi:demethylmenaquinone methyltransferase / 2-methoxy-6-polyprenyl-1,4-benzoquinol methylase
LSSEKEKARAVSEMFGSIATRYDFLNHFLSGNIDRRWRRKCVREIARRVCVSMPRILDLGCGTADLSIAFSRFGKVVGCDFCHPMLRIGRKKIARSDVVHAVELAEGDALNLPFPGGVFDVVVSAFVVRNLANSEKGLQEMRRVLRPGGVLGILDFAMPRTPLLGLAYRFYFMQILPRLGKWISGVDGPYRYLPDSVESFPPPEAFCDRITHSGFRNAEYYRLTLGIAVMYVATADAAESSRGKLSTPFHKYGDVF